MCMVSVNTITGTEKPTLNLLSELCISDHLEMFTCMNAAMQGMGFKSFKKRFSVPTISYNRRK